MSMATIEVTIRQDNGVNVTLSASPSDDQVSGVIDAILVFVKDYPISLGARPAEQP